jgi:hypothetical protein
MKIPKDVHDLFDNLLPVGLAKFPDRAREIGAVYLFKITGDGGGEWTVNCSPALPPSCVRGDLGKAQCKVEIANPDFQTMLADPNVSMQLYFQGKLRVNGDPMLAMKLQHLFALALE